MMARSNQRAMKYRLKLLHRSCRIPLLNKILPAKICSHPFSSIFTTITSSHAFAAKVFVVSSLRKSCFILRRPGVNYCFKAFFSHTYGILDELSTHRPFFPAYVPKNLAFSQGCCIPRTFLSVGLLLCSSADCGFGVLET